MVEVALNRDEILKIIETVPDPEIPVLSVIEMGMVRDVILDENGVSVIVTPTYSGCPAMDQIQFDIYKALEEVGINAKIITRLSPAWTTDWMSEETLEKLRSAGIAPPRGKSQEINPLNIFKSYTPLEEVECPYCRSSDTKVMSQYGSTPCKSLHYCNHCQQGFEHFKCH